MPVFFRIDQKSLDHVAKTHLASLQFLPTGQYGLSFGYCFSGPLPLHSHKEQVTFSGPFLGVPSHLDYTRNRPEPSLALKLSVTGQPQPDTIMTRCRVSRLWKKSWKPGKWKKNLFQTWKNRMAWKNSPGKIMGGIFSVIWNIAKPCFSDRYSINFLPVNVSWKMVNNSQQNRWIWFLDYAGNPEWLNCLGKWKFLVLQYNVNSTFVLN